MLHGKKGFERIAWAFKNVLNYSLAWLFVDLNSERGGDEQLAEMKKHHPFDYRINPKVMRMMNVSTPQFPPIPIENVSLDYAEELFEWLGLLVLESPRIRVDDDVDSFLCRYQPPGLVEDFKPGGNRDQIP